MLNKLHDREKCVAILLPIFNGEKYLDDLLVSLENQIDVCGHLFILDDSSTDDSLEILNKYENLCFDLLINPTNLGSTCSFLKLVTLGLDKGFKYFAFCDQDDVWHENLLKNALHKLRANTHLYIPTYAILDMKRKVTYQVSKVTALEDFIFENPYHGCGMVFTESLARRIATLDCRHIIQHDFATVFMAAAMRAFTISDSTYPEISYRIHEKNERGLRDLGYLSKSLIDFRTWIRIRIQQARYLNNHLRLEQKNFNLIERFVTSSFRFRLRVVSSLPKLRAVKWEDLVLKTLLLIYKD